MLIVVSPAKKLNENAKIGDEYSQPVFVDEAEKLISYLRKKTPKKIEQLMGISKALGELNFERYQGWKTEHTVNNSNYAGFMFDGEVYSGLDIKSYSKKELQWAQAKLRILSGLYGVLKPLDLIQPYRLEMGTSLKTGRKKNLYEFWGDKITNEINSSLEDLKTETIVNLASTEYFKSINKKKLNAEIVTPVFKDFNNGKYKTVMVYAKKARGFMASFIIKNNINTIEELKAFDVDGYCFNQEASNDKELVFLRG